MEARADELLGMPARWWEGEGEEAAAQTVYLHDVPASGAVWAPFLDTYGGLAPDLPGFGRSGKGGQFAYDFDGYGRWLEAWAARVGLAEPFDLVVHGWGAVGLPWALGRPERVRRLVLLAPLPLTPDFRPGALGRLLRRRVLGEWAMGFGFRPVFDRTVRRLHGAGNLPQAFLDELWRDFDPGTQRAILRLHRMAGPEALEKAGRSLSSFRGRALVAWGEEDEDLDPGWAGVIAERLSGGEADVVRGAGHWIWIDDVTVLDLVIGFLRSA